MRGYREPPAEPIASVEDFRARVDALHHDLNVNPPIESAHALNRLEGIVGVIDPGHREIKLALTRDEELRNKFADVLGSVMKAVDKAPMTDEPTPEQQAICEKAGDLLETLEAMGPKLPRAHRPEEETDQPHHATSGAMPTTQAQLDKESAILPLRRDDGKKPS